MAISEILLVFPLKMMRNVHPTVTDVTIIYKEIQAGAWRWFQSGIMFLEERIVTEYATSKDSSPPELSKVSLSSL